MSSVPSSIGPGFFQDRTALRIVLVSFIARALAAALVGPGFDEAYYHLFARHLAPGYFDHPPLVAVTAGLGWWLSGGWYSPLALRFGALLWFTVAQLGFWRLARDLYGEKAARIALLLPLATPFFAIGAGAFVIPDNALVAVWIWSLWLLYAMRQGSLGKNAGFAALGLLLGLAMLAKYHAVLLVASFAVATMFDSELRSWWRDLRLYGALLLAVLVFLPTILWNANNGWISFAEQFGKGTSGGFRIRFDLLGQALGGQLGYLTPWVCVILWVGSLRKTAPEERWLLSFFLVPVLAMTLIGLTRGILPHWTMPGYIAAFVLASGWMVRWRRERGFITGSLVVNALLVTLVILQADLGLFAFRPKADPTLDPAGWRQTLQELERRGELGPDDVIFAHKWFTAAELAWADRGRHDVVLLGDYPHNFAWWAPEVAYRGRSGVAVTQARYRMDARERLVPRFAGVEPLEVPPLRRGRTELKMQAWRVTDLRQPMPPLYGPWAPAGE